MAGSIAKLVVSLGANIAGFETDMQRATRNQSRRMKQLERDAKRAGAVIGAALGTGLVLATREAIKFEKAMAEVSTLLEDTSSLDNLSNSVKQLSIQFGQAPTEQAKALYQIISAGASDAATQVELLTASNKLAVGGVTDVKTAADGLTTVLNAYAGSGLDSATASDILFTTMKQGKTTIEELSSSIGNVATIASQVGVSFDEVGASVGTLTKVGLDTSQAMTALQGVLAAVVKQGKQSIDAADELGIAFNVAAIQSQGFAGFLQSIAESGATEEQLSKLFGRVEGLTAVMALGSNEMAEFTAQLEAQAAGAGATEEAFAKMADTTAFKISQTTAAFQVLSIEIGSTFLAAISDAATGAVENIDTIRKFIVQLVESFRVLGAVAEAVGAGLVAVFVTITASIVSAVQVTIQALSSLNNVALAVIQQNFAAIPGIIEKAMVDIQAALESGGREISTAFSFAAEGISGINEAVLNAGAALNKFDASLRPAAEASIEAANEIEKIGDSAAKSGEEIEDYDKKLQAVLDSLDPVAAEARVLAKELEELTIIQRKGDLTWDQYRKAVEQATAKFGKAVDELRGITKASEEAARAQQKLIDASQAVIDQLDEGGAIQREFIRDLEDLKAGFDQAESGGLTLDEAIRRLTEDYYKAIAASEGLIQKNAGVAQSFKKTTDFLSVALDESIRILQRTFQDIFEGLADDAFDTWGAIEEGFKSLAATISRTPINLVFKQVSDAFAEGGGGLSDLKLSGQFGQDLVRSIGSIIGFGSADSLFGQIGSSLGSFFGETLFSAVGKSLFPKLLTGLGSFAGPIGTALGAILGSVLGDFLGGLFERDLSFALGGENQRTLADNQTIQTDLGTILSPRARGGFGSLLDPNTLGGEIAKALTEFDRGMAELLRATVDDSVFDDITTALDNWLGEFGEGATIADILGSRFEVILGQFSSDIQEFVNGAESFEEQIERFGVALSVDKFLRDNPEFFSGRTAGEVLRVVQAFQNGSETMAEAFDQFAQVANSVISITEALKDFAGSDLEADFQALINTESLEQSLANVSAALLDSINNFDGSIESLSQIGQLMLVVREGELKLLQQIDSVQKGLTASLQNLRDFVTGAIEQPKSITETLLDAEGLLRAVQAAETAGEVATIGQEFDALIRSLSPEQLALAGNDLLQLIDLFDQFSSERLSTLREDVISDGEIIRASIDEFLVRVGDPLDIIANSLEGENIPEALNEGFSEVADNNTANTDRIIQALYATAGQGSVIVVNPDAGLVNQ